MSCTWNPGFPGNASNIINTTDSAGAAAVAGADGPDGTHAVNQQIHRPRATGSIISVVPDEPDNTNVDNFKIFSTYPASDVETLSPVRQVLQDYCRFEENDEQMMVLKKLSPQQASELEQKLKKLGRDANIPASQLDAPAFAETWPFIKGGQKDSGLYVDPPGQRSKTFGAIVTALVAAMEDPKRSVQIRQNSLDMVSECLSSLLPAVPKTATTSEQTAISASTQTSAVAVPTPTVAQPLIKSMQE